MCTEHNIVLKVHRLSNNNNLTLSEEANSMIALCTWSLRPSVSILSDTEAIAADSAHALACSIPQSEVPTLPRRCIYI